MKRTSRLRRHAVEMYASAAKTPWSSYDLDLRALTLKTFSAMPADMLNIYAKFHCNFSGN